MEGTDVSRRIELKGVAGERRGSAPSRMKAARAQYKITPQAARPDEALPDRT